MPKLWDSYGSGNFRGRRKDFSGIAGAVLSACGIEYSGSGGGSLNGVDIKRMDAMAAIKASLFESLKGGSLYELIADNSGGVKIIEVGTNGASVSNVYYTCQTYSYRNSSEAAVMVTGGTPLPERKIGDYTELLSADFGVKYWEADVISSACAMQSLKRFVTITYNDPHLTSAYEDGIDNLYDVANPFESVVGYVYDVDYGSTSKYVEITFSDKATVPIKIVGGIGTLAKTEAAAADYMGQDEDCLRGLGTIASCGDGAVNVPLPDELRYDDRVASSTDKFLGVSAVYVLGYKVGLNFLPSSEEESLNAPSTENVGVWIVPEDTTLDIVKLTEGRNYAVAYDEGGVCIQFADRSPLDMQGLCGPSTNVKIPAWSAYYDDFSQTVDLLPIDETTAVVVKEVWAALDVSSPCINVFDPKGEAMSIATQLSIKIAPISVIKKPAPVALNGGLINQEDGIADHDPTTTQDFSNSAMDTALDSMDGKLGLSVNMSSLDEAGVCSLSAKLQELYQQDSGVYTTYICGPNTPFIEVGSLAPDGGIVNSVEYRYNDKSSATATITSGPVFSGNFVASVNNGTYLKKDESVTLEGVIVGDSGNGGYYSVHLEGLGRREAMNGTMAILRVGDIVNVAVHNNPVEA